MRYGVLTIDEEGIVRSADPGALHLLGSRGDMAGAKVVDLLPGVCWAELTALGATNRSRRPPVSSGRARLTAVRSAGGSIDVDVTLREVRLGNRRLFAAILRESPPTSAKPVPAPGEDKPTVRAQSAADIVAPEAQPTGTVVERKGEVALIDSSPVGRNAAGALPRAGLAVAPIDAADSAFDASSFRCVAVNLASPEAVGTVRCLMNGHGFLKPSCLAYSLPPGAGRGCWVGPVEFVSLTAGSGALDQALQRISPDFKRAMILSDDMDMASQLREQLAAARISVSVVFDARQAVDLLPSVRPNAILVYLSPRSANAFRALAVVLREGDGNHLPVVFLLDADPPPGEAAFIKEGAGHLSARGTLRPGDLEDALLEALRQTAPPQDRAA